MAIFYGLESPQYRRQRLFRISKNWSDMAYATLRYQMRGKARLWGHPKALDIVNRNGKWYASIVLEIDDTLLKNSRKTDNGIIAIDLGCNDAIAWTNGEENGLVRAPRFFRKAEQKNKQLGKAKRRKRSPNFQKKVKASRRWKKVQKLVSRLSRKVANQRQNFVHQETTRIISGNSTVVTEVRIVG